jgi:hypothetical protein
MDDNTPFEKAREAIQNGKLPTRSPDRTMCGEVRHARYMAKQCGGIGWSLRLSSDKMAKHPNCTNTISTPSFEVEHLRRALHASAQGPVDQHVVLLDSRPVEMLDGRVHRCGIRYELRAQILRRVEIVCADRFEIGP